MDPRAAGLPDRMTAVVIPSNRRALPETPGTRLKKPRILSSAPETESCAQAGAFSSNDHFAIGPASWALATAPGEQEAGGTAGVARQGAGE